MTYFARRVSVRRYGDLKNRAFPSALRPQRSFARTWLNELKGRNIRVNVLSPGAGRHTGFPATRQGDAGDVRNPWSRRERWVVLRKFATVALFLASDEAGFVNGVELSVDGGFSAIWIGGSRSVHDRQGTHRDPI